MISWLKNSHKTSKVSAVHPQTPNRSRSFCRVFLWESTNGALRGAVINIRHVEAHSSVKADLFLRALIATDCSGGQKWWKTSNSPRPLLSDISRNKESKQTPPTQPRWMNGDKVFLEHFLGVKKKKRNSLYRVLASIPISLTRGKSFFFLLLLLSPW